MDGVSAKCKLQHKSTHEHIGVPCTEPVQRLNTMWSSQDLCAAVARRGFAVLRLSPADADLVRKALLAAEQFFEQPIAAKTRTTQLVDEAAAGTSAGGSKGLVGFNRVSAAKDVFRIRRFNYAAATVQGDKQLDSLRKKRRHSAIDCSHSVWPLEWGGCEFRKDVEIGWAVLEKLVLRCTQALLGQCDFQRWQQQCTKMHTSQLWSAAPLDLFWYPNDTFASSTVNCIDHTDPGLLSAIPCAATPGLMVKSHGTAIAEHATCDKRPKQWIDVEAADGAIPYRDVCVFPGIEMERRTGGRIKATVHGVRKESRPRASIVYELRSELLSTQSDAKSLPSHIQGSVRNAS